MNGFELRWFRCHRTDDCAVAKAYPLRLDVQPMKLQYRTKEQKTVDVLHEHGYKKEVWEDWSEWIDVPMGDSE